MSHYSDSSLTISLTSSPLPRPSPVKFEDLINNALINPDAFRYAISLTIGMCLFVSVYLVFPLIERVTNAKQVQIMTGVHPGIFWLANLAWDITLLLVSAALAIILIVVLDSNSFFTTNGAGGEIGNTTHKGLSLFLFFLFTGILLFIILMFGLSAIPFTYLLSFMAKTQANGFTISIMINILAGERCLCYKIEIDNSPVLLAGCIAPVTVWVLRSIGEAPGAAAGLVIASDAVRYIFSFVPSYSLAFAILGLVNTQSQNNVCLNNVDSDTLKDLCAELTNVWAINW